MKDYNDNHEIKISVAVGYTTRCVADITAETLEEFVKEADEKMYANKKLVKKNMSV